MSNRNLTGFWQRARTHLPRAAVVILLTGFAYAIDFYLYQFFRQQVRDTLQVSLEISYRSIVDWFESREQLVMVSTRSLEFRNLWYQHRDKALIQEDVRTSPLIALLEGDGNVGYAGFEVWSDDGSVIATSFATPENYRRQLFFQELPREGCRTKGPLLGESWFYTPEQHRGELGPPMVLVACRFFVGSESGVLAVRYLSNESLTEVLVIARFGATGETYAVNQDGWLITPSRFSDSLLRIGLIQSTRDQGVLAIRVADPGADLTRKKLQRGSTAWPLTRMAESVTRGYDGWDVDGYNDYRGIPVVGAWRWNENHGFGLTHEIDQVEAYATFSRSRFFLIMATVIIVLLTLFLMEMAARRREAEKARIVQQKEFEKAVERLRLQTVGQEAIEWSSLLVHEISQPMTTILNLLTVALRRKDAERGELIEKARIQAEFSADIISRARRRSGRWNAELRPLNVKELVDRCIELYAPTLEINKARVVADIDPTLHIMGDEVQMQQVFVNLFRNAVEAQQHVKSASKSLPLEIRVEANLALGSDEVVVDVIDNGPGVPLSMRETMFFPGASTKPQGGGLGLAMIRRVLEGQKGQIAFVSTEVGAHFRLRIPVA